MGTLHNFRAVQADIRAVPIDWEGIVAAELERALYEVEAEGKRVKLIYTISSFHNPTAVTLSEQRRHEVLALAAEHDALILDDTAYRELWFRDPPPSSLAALADGHGVITTGTFSKILATGLRVGCLAPPEWIELFGRMRFDMGQSVLIQRMLELLGELKSDAVWRAGAEEGVWFPGGTSFFADRVDTTGEHIRLAFPWTPAEELREGARRIGIACARAAEDA